MKAKNHKVLERCIEDGIGWGLNRAYKHEDDPSKNYIADCIQEAITNEIYEWFNFGEPFDAP